MRYVATRISKWKFYRDGAFSNPRLYRKMVSGRWQYYRNN